MSEQLITGITTVALGIIGVAIIAVLVAQRAQTAQVVQATAQGFTQSLGAAISPVAGGLGL